jgi:hypothetical protein
VFCISHIHCGLTGLHYYYVHRKDMTIWVDLSYFL